MTLQRHISKQPLSLSEMGELLQTPRPEREVSPSPAAAGEYRRTTLSNEAIRYFDSIVATPSWKRKMGAYVVHSTDFLSKVIPPHKKVLLVGCLTTEILESLQPALGVGLDVSEKYVRLARNNSRSRNITYHACLPENFKTEVKFDYVVLLNVVDHTNDILALVDSLKRFVHDDSRVVISMLNPLWHPLVRAASKLKIRIPDYRRNLVASRSIASALEIKKFKVMEVAQRVLVPKPIPFISRFFNQYLTRLPLLNRMGFIQYVTAKVTNQSEEPRLSCSVIVPCFNEEGNIAECVRRVPKMGKFTEIVVVNDGSKDNTLATVRGLQAEYPNLTVVTYAKNRGKGNAVLEGMRTAKGDVVMILDADMTVPPEELTDFFEALESNTADFASGTRFVYPMEKEAMRLANYLGNIVFSKLVEIIVGSECTDTLCGTKAMRKIDFADFKLEDAAWGDFDLIFHAAKRKLKCVQVPVHYKSRVAGESKMKAFSAGLSFFKLCLRKWAEVP